MPPCNIWIIHTLKNNLFFTCNSSLTEHLVFYLITWSSDPSTSVGNPMPSYSSFPISVIYIYRCKQYESK